MSISFLTYSAVLCVPIAPDSYRDGIFEYLCGKKRFKRGEPPSFTMRAAKDKAIVMDHQSKKIHHQFASCRQADVALKNTKPRRSFTELLMHFSDCPIKLPFVFRNEFEKIKQ